MFKGIYLQGKPQAWRGRKKIGLAASAAAILLAAALLNDISQGKAELFSLTSLTVAAKDDVVFPLPGKAISKLLPFSKAKALANTSCSSVRFIRLLK